MEVHHHSHLAQLLKSADVTIAEFNAALFSLKIASFTNRRRARILIAEAEKLMTILKKNTT